MSKKVLSQTITKKQALEGIGTILKNFNNLIIELNWDLPKTNYTELKKFADYMTDEGYLDSFRSIPYQTVLDNVDTEGYLELITKCGKLSKLYGLDVEVPENVEVLGEGVVEAFITDLTQDALDAIARNRTELVIEKTVLLEQVEQLDFNDEKYTKLEWIIKSKQAFNVAKAENDRATEEITNLACSHQIDGYEPWYKMQKESEKRMQAIITECPFVIFFSGKSDTKKVEKEINALVKKINSGLDGVEEKIRNGTYPIWELTPLISNLLKKDKYQGKEEVILKEFDKWRSDKYKKELFFTIGSIVLSVAGLLIPGGCCFGLLLAKAVTTTAGAAMGIAQSVDEFTQAGINKDTAYASLRLSDDQIALVENADVSEATKEYILSGVFLGLGIFDVADAAKSVKLIFKLDKLDDVTRLALKNSKRFGEKAFKELSVERLNTLDDYFLLFYNNDSANIVRMYQKLPADVVCKEPEDLLRKYTKTFEKFDDFAADVGKNFTGSVDDKVRIIQNSFENLSSGDRHLLTIPDDAIYVTGFTKDGYVKYLWPDNLGIKPGSDAAVISAKGNVALPDKLYRVGSYRGNNFSDAVYSYDELAVPYKYNDEALTVFKIRKDSYIKKIDAIASGNIDELNKILESEGIKTLSKIQFDDIVDNYKYIQSSIKKGKISCNTKYGIKGTVAEWYNPNDKTVKWFNGGAPQFITPLNVRDMKTLGIITEIE